MNRTVLVHQRIASCVVGLKIDYMPVIEMLNNVHVQDNVSTNQC